MRSPSNPKHDYIAYREGCRCPICTADHNEKGKAHAKRSRAAAQSMKLELARLQAFEARVLAAVSQGEQVAQW
jgi:hypothetical protein